MASVDESFSVYKLDEVTRVILDFLDNLTNWYIRRSRRRFWKSGDDSDKSSAYETLYHVLVTVTKVMAPMTPFVAEEVFRGLTGKESVHLELFPEVRHDKSTEALVADMDKTQKIVNLALSLRGSKKIRVRQPLATLTIGEKLDNYFMDIIKEEVNVKEVRVDDMSSVARKICKPNAKLLGARLGKDMQPVIVAAKSGIFTENADGSIMAGGFVLAPHEFEIAYEALDTHYDIQADFGMVIMMDTTITEELKIEGFARDIIRGIQDARKEAGYEVTDRIKLAISGEKAGDILASHKAYIESETLSVIVDSLDNADMSREVDLEEAKVNLEIKR